MKDPYHCPYCDQRSTRRWNLQVHIKRKHGGSPDPYIASHQFEPSNPYHNIQSTTVADNGWNSFQPRYGLQQAPVGISQYSTSPNYPPMDVSQAFANPMYRPMATMDDQSFGTGLSPETTHKINDLRRLVYKYRQYQNIDPDEIVKWAINGALKGDTQFLDKKLEQLQTIEFSRSISS